MAYNTIMVYGFKAEVLEEKRWAYFGDSTHHQTFEMVGELAGKPTKAVIDDLKAKALAKGFDQVVLRLDRYIRYSLRSVMQNRSGGYNKITTYKHKDGVWTKTIEIDNQTY